MVSPAYRNESQRLASKYLNQISRKTQDLMNDPTPGGSRTPLKQYPGLCRLKAGEFRIIYAYNETVVELLTLRRRDEGTYDHLDHLEVQQLEEFRRITGSGPTQPPLRDWAEAAKTYKAPTRKPREPLSRPITREMLGELKIPEFYWDALLQIRTADDLVDCSAAPMAILDQVLECVYPRESQAPAGDPLPVVVREDLLDDLAAIVSGPIDTSTSIGALGAGAKSASPQGPSELPTPLLLVPTRKHEQMTAYRGNTSKAVGKEARYTVKLDGKVQLTYGVSSDQRALLTIDGHDELVDLVNEAKRRGGAQQGGGSFFINEYRHVLVPTQSSGILFAGIYTRDLEFDYGDSVISPVARSGIERGDVWPGPHVGIKYTLTAGAADIRCELETGGGVVQRVLLSESAPPERMVDLLKMCRAVKPQGGAIYINEARELFAPAEHGEVYERLYIGHLGTKPWFPEPV